MNGWSTAPMRCTIDLRLRHETLLMPATIKKPVLCALAATAALFGCGGGGGSSGDIFVPPSPTAAAEGLYRALTVTNRIVTWLILDDGAYWLLYSTVGGSANSVAGVVQGTGTSSGGSFTSGNGRDFNFEGQGVQPATVTATYTPKQALSGTVGFGGSATGTGVSGSYDSQYDTVASLPPLVGTYVGAVAATGGSQAAVMNVGSSGSINGAVGLCGFTGNATPRSRGNVYAVTISFGSAPCAAAGQSFSGVGYLDAPNRRLYAVALNGARTDGLLFLGTR